LSEKTSLSGVLGKKNMSFPRKRESSLFDLLENLWIPAFAGMTTFARGLFIQLQPAVKNAHEAIQLWIDTAEEFGDPIPEPKGRLMYA